MANDGDGRSCLVSLTDEGRHELVRLREIGLDRFALFVADEWRRLKPVMLAARVLGPLCFVLLGVSSSVGSVQGLMERLLVTVCVAWMLPLPVTLIANARRGRLGFAREDGVP